MTDHLLVELDGHVLRLTLNQPHKKNAFSPEMVGALADALDSALSDDDVRVVVSSLDVAARKIGLTLAPTEGGSPAT